MSSVRDQRHDAVSMGPASQLTGSTRLVPKLQTRRGESQSPTKTPASRTHEKLWRGAGVRVLESAERDKETTERDRKTASSGQLLLATPQLASVFFYGSHTETPDTRPLLADRETCL